MANEEEKISCYVLAEIDQGEYKKNKRKIVNKITSASPDLKKAVKDNQVDFFKEWDQKI